jgi:hypothetical protein
VLQVQTSISLDPDSNHPQVFLFPATATPEQLPLNYERIAALATGKLN